MKLSIASYRRSLERDPELTVDRRSLKALDRSPLETTDRISKSNLDVACILVKDDHQTRRAILACRIGSKVRALCLKRRPVQCAPRKLLRQHQSVERRPHLKATSDRARYRRIKAVPAPMQVYSHTAHGRELQAEVSRP